MNLFLAIIAIVLVAVGAAALWVRSVDPDPARLARPDTMPPPGTETGIGGSTTVLTPDDPAGAFARLTAAIEATARTTRVSDGQTHRAYVTRTRIMGFPDVIHVWHDGTHLAISGHLTLGKGDAGVNRRRIAGWLDQAGLAAP